MKKIGEQFREISGNQIKNNLKDSNSVFIVSYSGLSSPDLSSLRLSLKSSKARLFVVKNTIARKVLKDSGLGDIVKTIEGPCAMVFAKEEPVTTSKVLYNFCREHEQLKLAGGFLKDRILDKKEIEKIAQLPSIEVLRARVVMVLNSPLSRLVYALNGNLSKLVCCLEQIKKKKGA